MATSALAVNMRSTGAFMLGILVCALVLRVIDGLHCSHVNAFWKGAFVVFGKVCN